MFMNYTGTCNGTKEIHSSPLDTIVLPFETNTEYLQTKQLLKISIVAVLAGVLIFKWFVLLQVIKKESY